MEVFLFWRGDPACVGVLAVNCLCVTQHIECPFSLSVCGDGRASHRQTPSIHTQALAFTNGGMDSLSPSPSPSPSSVQFCDASHISALVTCLCASVHLACMAVHASDACRALSIPVSVCSSMDGPLDRCSPGCTSFHCLFMCVACPQMSSTHSCRRMTLCLAWMSD